MQVTRFRHLVKEYGFKLGRKKSYTYYAYYPILCNGVMIGAVSDIYIVLYNEEEASQKLDQIRDAAAVKG